MQQDIEYVESLPDYINRFIGSNSKELLRIYNENTKELGIGCLMMNCINSENKMDVYFYSKDMYIGATEDNAVKSDYYSKDNWDNIYNKSNDRRICIVNDIDENNIFIVYI